MAENEKKPEKEKRASVIEIPLERMFLAEEIIPNAAEAFLAPSLSISDAIDKADIVLDTSALLIPYGSASESLKDIADLYKKLAKSKRLFIPGQAAREFVRNRPNKLSELQQGLLDKMSGHSVPDMPLYPILENLNEYSQMREVLKRTKEAQSEFKKSINALVEAIRDWEWNDPVSKVYREVLKKDVIIDCKVDQATIKSEMAHRFEMAIPPGYKDASKGDGGVGDYLIWKTILQIGEENKRPLIFVSGDEKPDWQHSSKGAAFLPRIELVIEYRKVSNGQTFYMVPLSRFLQLFGGESSSVADIQQAEERLNEPNETVQCPNCDFSQRVYLDPTPGTAATPLCPSCHLRFHVNRRRHDVVVRPKGFNGIRQSPMGDNTPNTETEFCPNCLDLVTFNLGRNPGSAEWISCEGCKASFPTRRNKDGSVYVSPSFELLAPST